MKIFIFFFHLTPYNVALTCLKIIIYVASHRKAISNRIYHLTSILNNIYPLVNQQLLSSLCVLDYYQIRPPSVFINTLCCIDRSKTVKLRCSHNLVRGALIEVWKLLMVQAQALKTKVYKLCKKKVRICTYICMYFLG